MFKLLLIIFLFFFVFIRLGGFIIKLLFSGFNNNQSTFQQNQRRQAKRPTDGNVNIDYVPDKRKSDAPNKNFKGGEYVDYEEMD